jgi:hypothetical protein
MTTAYPLQWPEGWTRRSPAQRHPAIFHQRQDTGRGYAEKKLMTLEAARRRLSDELDLLGAQKVTLSTNVELRADGQPRSGQEPEDPGAAVYFEFAGQPTVLACDRWNRVADNVTALSKHINAMRGMDRWGVGTAQQAFAAYKALPAPEDWWTVLGVFESASPSTINEAFRDKAKALANSDADYHSGMIRLNLARDAGLRGRSLPGK